MGCACKQAEEARWRGSFAFKATARNPNMSTSRYRVNVSVGGHRTGEIVDLPDDDPEVKRYADVGYVTRLDPVVEVNDADDAFDPDDVEPVDFWAPGPAADEADSDDLTVEDDSDA